MPDGQLYFQVPHAFVLFANDLLSECDRTKVCAKEDKGPSGITQIPEGHYVFRLPNSSFSCGTWPAIPAGCSTNQWREQAREERLNRALASSRTIRNS